MAFNPLKKVNVQQEQAESFANLASVPDSTIIKQEDSAEKNLASTNEPTEKVDVTTATNSDIKTEADYFEGASLEDLESTGINTMSALASAATPKEIVTKETVTRVTPSEIIAQVALGTATEKPNTEQKEINKITPAKPADIPEEIHVKETTYKTDEQRKLEKQARFRALKDLVNEIQVNLVMDELGASTNEDKTRGKRKLDGIGNFGINGQQWYNLNYMGTKNAGGVGAVGLIQHYLALNAGCSLYDEESYRKYFAPAVYWLSEKFGEAVNSDDIKATLEDMQRIEKKDKIFSPPPADDSVMEAVKKYLHEERFIPQAVIDKQVSEGKLYGAKLRNYIGAYEDYKKDPDPQFVDVPVAVFIAKAKTIAELRSIDPAYPIKRLAGGATRSHGFTVVHDFEPATDGIVDNAVENEKRKITACEGVSVVEAAIDAMSYSVFFPKRFVISSAGVNAEFAVKCAVITLGAGKPFFLAFDNDEAGNNAAKIFRESLVDKIGQPKFDEYVAQGLLKRHRARHGKDWNEDLEFLTKQALENTETTSLKP